MVYNGLYLVSEFYSVYRNATFRSRCQKDWNACGNDLSRLNQFQNFHPHLRLKSYSFWRLFHHRLYKHVSHHILYCGFTFLMKKN